MASTDWATKKVPPALDILSIDGYELGEERQFALTCYSCVFTAFGTVTFSFAIILLHFLTDTMIHADSQRNYTTHPLD